jgi:hypothetical protein
MVNWSSESCFLRAGGSLRPRCVLCKNEIASNVGGEVEVWWWSGKTIRGRDVAVARCRGGEIPRPTGEVRRRAHRDATSGPASDSLSRRLAVVMFQQAAEPRLAANLGKRYR